MRVDTPEDIMAASTSSTGKERRLRIKVLKERKKKMIDPTSIQSCDLLELPAICNKIEEKEQNIIRFYFEDLNGICSGLRGTDTGRFFNSLVERLEIDFFGAAETNLH